MFKLLAIIFLLGSIILTNCYKFTSKYNSNLKNITGIVTKYSIDGNKLTIYLKAKEIIIINYYLKTESEKEYYTKNLELGDRLKIVGELSIPNNNTIPNGFNYKKYLYHKKIYYLFTANNIKIVSKNTSIFYFFKNQIIKRITKIDKTGYLKIFITGEKDDLDNNILQEYQTNGVSHLFSISGMHVSLLASIILFILKKVSYNNKLNYLVVILFLLFYLFLTNFSSSILRTTIMFISMAINKCYNLKVKNIDIICLVLIIIIIINPFYIYDIGFQYSYLISFTLILLAKKTNKVRNKLVQSLYISFICFLVSFPISIYNFSSVNILSIFINIILIPLVSVAVYPLSLLTFIISPLINIFVLAVSILEKLNSIFANITIFQLVVSKPNIIIIFAYYVIIYLSLFNKKYYLLLVIMLLIQKNLIYYDNSLKVTVIDVGQGDSIFIKMPNNKENILIDTGGKISYNKEKWMIRKKNTSITKNSLIPYLKSMGLNKLNTLIITHGDYDHMGESINLVENFKVEKVIFNCGEFNDLEKELIKVLEKKKIKYYSCIKELNIDNSKLNFLQTKEYDNENDNSNVIYTELGGYKFMFMGDAGIEKEKDILDKYSISNIDVLKVGHHGSKTSSSKEFINEIDPKYNIISVGKNNRYGHPNKEVLENLENSKIYRTDQDGSIMFKIKKYKLQIETCSP